MKNKKEFQKFTTLSLAVACLSGFFTAVRSQPLPDSIAEPIRARCVSQEDPNPDVKYYYIIDSEYFLKFYAVLPGDAKFHGMRMTLWLPDPNHVSMNHPGRELSHPDESATLYWSETAHNNAPVMWELSSCGNVVHRVSDQVASLNRETNDLSVAQTDIEWIYNTCRGEFLTDAPVVTTVTGVFHCALTSK